MPEWSVLRHIGDASYSIYLLHGIILAVIVKLLSLLTYDREGWSGAILTISVSLIAASGIGFASYRLIERPMVVVLKRLMGVEPKSNKGVG